MASKKAPVAKKAKVPKLKPKPEPKPKPKEAKVGTAPAKAQKSSGKPECKRFLGDPTTVSLDELPRFVSLCGMPSAMARLRHGSRQPLATINMGLALRDADLYMALKMPRLKDALAAVVSRYRPTQTGFGGFDLDRLMAAKPLQTASHWRGMVAWTMLCLMAVMALTKRACVLLPPPDDNDSDEAQHVLQWTVPAPVTVARADPLPPGAPVWLFDEGAKQWVLASVGGSGKSPSQKTVPIGAKMVADVDLVKRILPGRLRAPDFVAAEIDRCPHTALIASLSIAYVRPDGILRSHQNMLLFDYLNKAITRFDPRGQTDPVYQPSLLDAHLERLLLKDRPGWRYHGTSESCGVSGLQMLQIREKVQIKNAPGGFCAAWSLYWIHQTLLHPELSRKDLLRSAEQWLLEQVRLKRIPNLTAFIAAYATALQETGLALLDAVAPRSSGPRTLDMFPTDLDYKIGDQVSGKLRTLMAYLRNSL